MALQIQRLAPSKHRCTCRRSQPLAHRVDQAGCTLLQLNWKADIHSYALVFATNELQSYLASIWKKKSYLASSAISIHIQEFDKLHRHKQLLFCVTTIILICCSLLAIAQFLIACSHVETVERFDRQYLLDAAALGRWLTARPVAGYLHTRRPGIGWMETREHRMDAEMNIMEPSALAWDHWGFSDEEVAGGNGQSSEIRWERKVENDRIRKETKGMQMTNIPYAIIFFNGF